MIDIKPPDEEIVADVIVDEDGQTSFVTEE